MKKKAIVILLIFTALSIAGIKGSANGPSNSAAAEIDIPYQKFILDNGLTLIVHEDHKAPIVAVNVWYHVGSKNEKQGRTGFAHLFEHLMFNGSENFNKDYFQALERIGSTDLNGTTNNDRTNYFQNVPKSALDTVLWLESDRMGHLLGAIDQAKLDEQRGVVQNEKRQGENEPYAIAYDLITESTYPKGHPYSWTVIGSMEDLNAASLKDVQEWFKGYYGAANSVVVVAGDIDAKTAKEKVEKYFGNIPSGPPVARHEAWIAKRTGTHRQIAQDRVPQSRIYKVWNIPEWKSVDSDNLMLFANILGSGKTSRLYKRLVYNDQIATITAAYVDLNEIAGQFIIEVTARPGEDLSKVEKAIDEETAKLIAEGPAAEELQRVKTQYRAGFVRGIERIGGFGGKSDILAINQVFGASPDFFKTRLKRIEDAKAEEIKATATKWLSDGVYILEIHPFPQFKTAAADADRSKMPEPGETPDLKFPKFERGQLSNGLKIVLAERHSIPVVNFNLLIDAGFASDQFALPGAASFAMNMLDEGTKTRSALQISEQLDMLGANLFSGSGLDTSNVYLSALKDKLDPSLDIFADVVLNPLFPEEDFKRLQKQRIAQIQREKTSPVQMALRIFPGLLYGKDHAYSAPFTGSGTEESTTKLTPEDLKKFRDTWIKPNNATIVIVGDTTMEEIKPKLEKLFANWKPGDVPKKNISAVSLQPKPSIYILDKPGALQSIIIAGNVAPSTNNPDETAIETMNNILGGAFTSRLNLNLREDKHWSYGASSFLVDAKGQRPFLAFAPVQTDKTKESMVEMDKELRGILSSRPATAEELVKNQSNQTLSLPGSRETSNALLGSLATIVTYGLPDDYFETYPNRVRALKLDNIEKAAKTVVRPDNMVWVIVGDRSKIEAGIRELGLGEIKLIDPDGNPVK